MAELGYIQIARVCNQNCRFCSNPSNGYVLPWKAGKSIIDQYIRQGLGGVILTGGEPTLNKDLPKFLEYCRLNHFPCRVISNGQNLSKISYVKLLKMCGLSHIHISVYSYKPEIQAYLSGNPLSLVNIAKAFENIGKVGGMTVNVNTVINKYNASHLSGNVKWLVKAFPYISHFVWNNIDPLMIGRSNNGIDTIPKLKDFKKELNSAMGFLIRNSRTFRVESVPLCYMGKYAEFSTETRKIVKRERRAVYFLDEKGMSRQELWYYDKAESCGKCGLNEICAGLRCSGKYFSLKELHPVFSCKSRIIRKILSSG